MNSHEVFIHIHQGCFAGTGAIVRLPQCQWSKPDGYGKISQCITTTKHSKAKTVCIFLGIYCNSPDKQGFKTAIAKMEESLLISFQYRSYKSGIANSLCSQIRQRLHIITPPSKVSLLHIFYCESFSSNIDAMGTELFRNNNLHSHYLTIFFKSDLWLTGSAVTRPSAAMLENWS